MVASARAGLSITDIFWKFTNKTNTDILKKKKKDNTPLFIP